ncbi:MAG: hypothetical protein ACK2T3_03085 [Candidatus Promineifilaceae bacterium]
MDDLPFVKRLFNRVSGYLYATLYFISDRLIFGASLLGWLTLLCLLLGAFSWLRTGSINWFLGFLLLIFVLRLLYWKAKRDGFIVFTSQNRKQPPSGIELIRNFRKYDLHASGVFSVTGREEYMFRRPTKLWRVPFGDHALMVERPSGRFLYQFIEDGHIRGIAPGCLIYGSKVNEALEIDFRTTWGPVAGETEFKWYAPRDSSEPKRYKRVLYLGFQAKDVRDAVWHSLLVGRPLEKRAKDDD